jgi:hypothetical protein
MEITRQADYYGLPDNAPSNVPPAERLADILSKPTPWSGPSKVAAPLEPNSQQKIQQGIQNTMPEPPEPWEAPDYTNGKPL